MRGSREASRQGSFVVEGCRVGRLSREGMAHSCMQEVTAGLLIGSEVKEWRTQGSKASYRQRTRPQIKTEPYKVLIKQSAPPECGVRPVHRKPHGIVLFHPLPIT
jgi:hypothetical protein